VSDAPRPRHRHNLRVFRHRLPLILVDMSRRGHDVIHITIPASPDDPRSCPPDPAGIVIHRSPKLHRDDFVTLAAGLRVTSVARTLIDLAEDMTRDELRAAFAAARSRGLLDLDALAASRARVEWRPSLAMVDEVIAEFSPVR
jgi:hypothetical protein